MCFRSNSDDMTNSREKAWWHLTCYKESALCIRSRRHCPALTMSASGSCCATDRSRASGATTCEDAPALARLFPQSVAPVPLPAVPVRRRATGGAHRAAERFVRSEPGVDARRRTRDGHHRHRVLHRASVRRPAEVAFAVADAFQGKGLGTALLERLAVAAGRHGISAFRGDHARGQRADARRVPRLGIRNPIQVRSGRLRRRAAVARSVGDGRRARGRRGTGAATAASLRPLLEPRAVAVIGASREPVEHRPPRARRDRRGRVQRADLSREPARAGGRRPEGVRVGARPAARRRSGRRRGSRRRRARRRRRLRRRGRPVAGRHHAPVSPKPAPRAGRCSSS